MRAAPLVLVAIALAIGAAGIWMLGSSNGSAPELGDSGLLPRERQLVGSSHSRAHTSDMDLDPIFDAPPIERAPSDPGQLAATPVPSETDSASLAERSSPTPEAGTVRIVGQVTTAGAAARGVKVRSLDNGVELTSVVTQPDGSFVIDLPSDAAGPLALRFDSPSSYPLALPLGRLTNERTDLGQVRLEPGTPLDGKITGPAGAAAPGAWLIATPARQYTVATDAQVDPSGAFHLPMLPNRSRIFAGAPGHATLQLSGRSLQATARSDPEQLASIELSRGHSFEFKLLDPEGKPIPSAWIQLIPNSYGGQLPFANLPFPEAEKCPSVLNATTDERGRVRLDELAPEPYFLRAESEGFSSEFGLRIDPFSGEHYQLSLERAPLVWISVLGFDPETDQSLPIEGLRFGLLAAEQRLWIEAQPSADGTLRRFLPDSNRWTYEAWAPGFELQAGLIVPAATPSAPPQSVLLFPAETDSIRITADDAQLLESAKLTGSMMSRARRSAAVPAAEPWRMPAFLITPGIFEVPRASSNGSPTWKAEAPGYLTRTWGLLDWPRPSPSGPLELELRPAATLLVQVTAQSGEPIAGAKVYLTQNGKGSPEPWITNSEGHVQLTNLEPGTLTVQARDPSGAISKRTNVDLQSGEDLQVTIEL